MANISVIAIRHPTIPGLYLHGLRRDNQKWSLAGGHAEENEIPIESAYRELKEETNISIKKLSNVRNGSYPVIDKPHEKNDVSLFLADCPEDLDVNSMDDPDLEFSRFKFLNPALHENMHINKENNILVHHMNQIEKAEKKREFNPDYSVKYHICDKFHPHPTKSNVILSVFDKNGNKIARAYFMHREKGISAHNMNIKDGHDPHKIFALMKQRIEPLMNKNLIPSTSI